MTDPTISAQAARAAILAAPMRVLVELAAITGETQTLDIFYTTIRGIKSRAE